jgi:outer membrane protein OmpA-like peptidoglycan-associated protein
MRQRKYLIAASTMIMVAIFSSQVFGQFQSKGVRVGAGAGILGGVTEKVNDKTDKAARFFLRHNITDCLDGDFAASYGGIQATDYQVGLYLAEYKILYKLSSGTFEPYIGTGLGIGYYDASSAYQSTAFKRGDYVGYIPLTIGLECEVTDGLQFDLNANFSYSFSDAIVTDKQTNLDGGGANDAWWGVFAGASITLFGSDNDADRDGIIKSEEEQLGTDPNKADTDGDGLSDGDEVNKYYTNPLKADSDGDGLSDKDEIVVYNTNPNKADTDGDGLSDGDEVLKYKTDPSKVDTDGDGLKDGDEVNKYQTNPLKVDSDGDGLSDYDEIMIYKTDPNKADTDGDGLTDVDEVLKYKTDPLKVDTDGDGLTDGDEILKYKTNPLKADTDGDGLRDDEEISLFRTDPNKADTDGDGFDDGIEMLNKTNPLNPNDPPKEMAKPMEAPKAEALNAEVGKAIILEGLVFKSGKASITVSSDSILARALKTFLENPTIEVEIRGYTDNIGDAKKNVKLSQGRANAVKSWLVKRGVPASRIKANGYGSAAPVAPNTTLEGRAQNRRIEFIRIK